MGWGWAALAGLWAGLGGLVGVGGLAGGLLGAGLGADEDGVWLWALGLELGWDLVRLKRKLAYKKMVVSCAVGLGWARSSGFETEIVFFEKGEVVSRPEKKGFQMANSNKYLFLS